MGFTAAQAARLTGCSLSQLSSWEQIGLVVPPPDPMHGYSFQDLVVVTARPHRVAVGHEREGREVLT